eukprot:1815663-Prymnesium_polylepis.2
MRSRGNGELRGEDVVRTNICGGYARSLSYERHTPEATHWITCRLCVSDDAPPCVSDDASLTSVLLCG